jgi:hypothetical protein
VIELKPITALVGGNTSGTSSALQAAQLCTSVLQASLVKPKGKSKRPLFLTTLSEDDVSFKPTGNLLDLRRGNPATQTAGFIIGFDCLRVDKNAQDTKNTAFVLKIKRGKNANLSLSLTGDLKLAATIGDQAKPFSIFTPGLSGIPHREEWRTRGALDAGAMHGDANLYLRSVLDHLLKDNIEGDNLIKQVQNGLHRRPIEDLVDGAWKTFCRLLDRCYPGARVAVNHDPSRARYVEVSVRYDGQQMSPDMASTGMLQVIQILAYACYYQPPLLILDEPDAHLHADSQGRLYDALRGLAHETDTRILIASHSPQLIQRLMYDTDASVIWMDNGKAVELDEARKPAIPLLMTLGALTLGADVFNPGKDKVLLTEDKITPGVETLASANGANWLSMTLRRRWFGRR